MALLAFVFTLSVYALQMVYKNGQAATSGAKTGNQNIATANAPADTTDFRKEKLSSVNQYRDSVSTTEKNDNKMIPVLMTHKHMAAHDSLKPNKNDPYVVTTGNIITDPIGDESINVMDTTDRETTEIKRSIKKIVVGTDNKSSDKAEGNSPYRTANESLYIHNLPLLKTSIAHLLTNTIDSNKLLQLFSLNRTTPIIAFNSPLSIHRIQRKSAVSLSVFFSLEQSKNRIANAAPPCQENGYGMNFNKRNNLARLLPPAYL